MAAVSNGIFVSCWLQCWYEGFQFKALLVACVACDALGASSGACRCREMHLQILTYTHVVAASQLYLGRIAGITLTSNVRFSAHSSSPALRALEPTAIQVSLGTENPTIEIIPRFVSLPCLVYAYFGVLRMLHSLVSLAQEETPLAGPHLTVSNNPANRP